MQLLQLSEATASYRKVPFPCVDATDGYTAETGLTFSAGELLVSKNGATEANAAGSVTEVAGGVYMYEFTAAELNTQGTVSLRVSKSGVRGAVVLAQVVPWDPQSATNLGLTNIDTTISSRSSLTVADIFARVIETGMDFQEAVQFIAAFAVGVTTGAGTGTEAFRAAVANHKVRFTSTIVGNNRTAVATDSTG